MMQVQSQDLPPYGAGAATSNDDHTIALALEILSRRVRRGHKFTDPKAVGQYFCLRSHALEHEVFSIAYLDAQHGLICVDTVAEGTINQASIYPREVVKSALKANAAAAILHHNHPSGSPEPSRADERLTKTLQDALALVEVRVLDHIVTGGGEWVSFAERGLI